VDSAGGHSRAVRLRLRHKATKEPAMDRSGTPSRRRVPIERSFVLSRLAQERVALAYEQLVPGRRQRLGGGRLSWQFEQRGCHRQSLTGVSA